MPHSTIRRAWPAAVFLPMLVVGLVAGAAGLCVTPLAAQDNSAEASAEGTPSEAEPVRVVLSTSKGEIVLELYPAKAPKTVENFLTYTRDGHYDGTIVYRVESFLIQAGSRTPDLGARQTRDPIPNEADNGLSNVRGSIGMARWGPHTATAEYYINTRDNRHLDHGRTQDDYGYTIFGKVVRGMDIVDAIGALPTERRGNLHKLPTEQVLITTVRVAEAGSEAATAPVEASSSQVAPPVQKSLQAVPSSKKGDQPKKEGKPVKKAQTMMQGGGGDGGDGEDASASIHLEGKMTAEGVECPAFRSTDGKLYTLLGDLGGFKAGDEVVIDAEPVEMSMCMQGTTVMVKKIARRGG